MNESTLAQNTKDEIGGDEGTPPIFKFLDFGSVSMSGVVTGYKLLWKEDSFVIDHPVRGEIDSDYYKIDGGYIDDVPFDLTYPIRWDECYKVKLYEVNI